MKAWVLGAGFSVPLGGPVLKQLLTPASLERMRFRYPKTWLKDARCDTCVEVLLEGTKRGHWLNAEEYLAALGSYDSRIASAVASMCPAAYLRRQDHEKEPTEFMQGLWIYARELVAAQCMNFFEESQDSNESWLPYDRWAKRVANDDVIISFNYDEVVENAFSRVDRPLCTPNPRHGEAPPDRRDEAVLVKLHGSVTFRDTIHRGEEDSIATLHHNPPFLAVPGTSKSEDSVSSFEEMWEFAAEALSHAESVAIIGYSCPKSDEMSKAMLLDTLASNRNKPLVDIVLGPSSSDAQRLVTLFTSAGISARDSSLWAEDYLTTRGVGGGWRPNDRIYEWSTANPHRLGTPSSDGSSA